METTLTVISKEINLKAIIQYTLLLIIGAAFIVVAEMYAVNPTTSLYFLLVTVGVCIAIVALIKIIANSKVEIYTPTKSPIYQKSLFIKCHQIESLINSLEAGDGSSLRKLICDYDTGLRLDATLSQDSNFVSCQLYRYVPYSYETASELITLENDKAQKLSSAITETQKK